MSQLVKTGLMKTSDSCCFTSETAILHRNSALKLQSHYYCNNSNIQKLIARTSCLIRSQFSQGPDKVDFGNDCLNGKHSRNIHVRIIVKVRASGYGSLKG